MLHQLQAFPPFPFDCIQDNEKLNEYLKIIKLLWKESVIKDLINHPGSQLQSGMCRCTYMCINTCVDIYAHVYIMYV